MKKEISIIIFVLSLMVASVSSAGQMDWLKVLGLSQHQSGINLGNTTDETAGNVRWTGSELEVYTGSVWADLINSDLSGYALLDGTNGPTTGAWTFGDDIDLDSSSEMITVDGDQFLRQFETIQGINILHSPALGRNAGGSSGSLAHRNLYLGEEAGLNSKTQYNLYGGFQTGKYHTVGASDVLLGAQAGTSASTINLSTLVGQGTGSIASALYESTLVGAQAGMMAAVHTRDTLLGYQAGMGVFGVGADLEDNIMVGAETGGQMTIAHDNIQIGNDEATLTDGYNNIIIGNSPVIPSGSVHDWLYIGNVITGDLLTGAVDAELDTLTSRPSEYTLTLSDNGVNTILTGPNGDFILKQAGGDFSFGDATNQYTSIKTSYPLFGGAVGYGGILTDIASTQNYSGVADLSGVGSTQDYFDLRGYDLNGAGAVTYFQNYGPVLTEILAGMFSSSYARVHINDVTGNPLVRLAETQADGTPTGNSIFNGHLAAGFGSSLYNATILSFSETMTDPTSESFAVQGILTADSTAGNWTAVNQGLLFGLITDGSNAFSANQTAAKFYMQNKSNATATGVYTGGEFVAGAANADTGNMVRVDAAQFSPQFGQSGAGDYAGDVSQLTLAYFTAPLLYGDGTYAAYNSIEIGDMNPNGVDVGTIRGIEVSSPSADAVDGYLSSFGYDTDWDSRVQDSTAWIFGTDSDVRCDYDNAANRLEIKPATGKEIIIGQESNHLNIENDGTPELVGDATVWDDMRTAPGSFDRPGISDPSLVAVDIDGGGTDTYLWEFNKGDWASFVAQLPHSYKEGTDIYVHAHWTPGARGTEETTATVGWKVDCSWANSEAVFGGMSSYDLSDACQSTDWEHLKTPSVAIDGHTVPKGISSMLLCNVRRTDTGADDTWATNTTGNLPLLLYVDFHFEKDTEGSRTATTK